MKEIKANGKHKQTVARKLGQVGESRHCDFSCDRNSSANMQTNEGDGGPVREETQTIFCTAHIHRHWQYF